MRGLTLNCDFIENHKDNEVIKGLVRIYKAMYKFQAAYITMYLISVSNKLIQQSNHENFPFFAYKSDQTNRLTSIMTM